MAKILLFCPTYEKNGVDQMWPDSLESFTKLRAPKGVKVVRQIGQDNPYPIDDSKTKHKNTLHQYQQAQRRALAEGFDALCTFENDMIVPLDGLQCLWDTPADVVYGIYLLRHGAWVINAFRHMPNAINIGESMSFYPDEYENAEKAEIVEVSGCGMGFTLIRRYVLERFQLRDWEGNYPPDWALACDCQAGGVKQVARFDVRCGHIDDSGVILWPGKEPKMTLKVLAIQSFVGDIGKGNQPFIAGQEYEGYPDLELEYVRAGFMQFIEEFPMVQAVHKLRSQPVETATARPGHVSQPPAARRRK